jgi:starch-binding outer membrane protein, SusD/RagB family
MKGLYKIVLTALVGSTILASCDVMDTSPTESYSEDLVWGSKSTADAFVDGAYSNILGGLYAGRYASTESYTPNGIHSDLTSLDGFPTETGLTNTYNAGFNQFSRLRTANMIIEKAQSSTVLTDAQKTELTAQGHFLRGMIFFYQARWMGRFVPITKLLNPSDTMDFKTPLTASVAESYKLILADFDAAIEGLPETSLPGVGNKYAAYAFESRAALQAYAYTGDKTYLDKCITASNAVINSGKYTLTSDYQSMFLEKGCYDPEIILGYYRLDKNTYSHSYAEMINCNPNVKNDELIRNNATPLFKNTNGRAFEGWASYFPTQDLVDQYLVTDDTDGQAKPWNETSQYKRSVVEKDPSTLAIGDFVTVPENNNRQVPDKDDMGANDKGTKIVKYGVVTDNSKINEIMYNNRDKRFYGTVVYDSCVWLGGETVTTCCRGNLWAGVRDGQADSWYTTASGYYWRKNVYEVSPRLYYGNKTNYHFVIARLGEMYMNLAEAYLLKGDVANAVSALNVTRVKHGGISASTASNLSDAWKDYIRERNCEMAYENDIYWSYLRWGKYGGDANGGAQAGAVINALNVPAHKIQITKDRKQYFIAQIVRNGAWNRNFTVRRYLMPIPQGQIDSRKASGINDTQNPGW